MGIFTRKPKRSEPPAPPLVATGGPCPPPDHAESVLMIGVLREVLAKGNGKSVLHMISEARTILGINDD